MVDIKTDKQLASSKTKEHKPWQWQPGQSGNPEGRKPKGQTLTDTMREIMEAQPDIKKALVQKLMQLALAGDVAALKLILSYIDGAPKQTIEQITAMDEGVILLREIVAAKRIKE